MADGGVAILTVLASPEYAGRHGACRITEQVSTILCVCTHFVKDGVLVAHTHVHTLTHTLAHT